MALSNVQIAILKERAASAKSALRYFKDIKTIKSTNNPFAFTKSVHQNTLDRYRTESEDNIVQSIEDATHFNVGNCDEKGRIVYSSLIGNPRLQLNSSVALCEATDGYDHVFVVISDNPITGEIKLSSLPDTTMIVDGWTHDWYFP